MFNLALKIAIVRCHSATLVHSGNCDAKKLRVSFQKHKSIDYGYPLLTRFHGTQKSCSLCRSQELFSASALSLTTLEVCGAAAAAGWVGTCWDSLMDPKIGIRMIFIKKTWEFPCFNSSYIMLTPMPMMCCMCVFESQKPRLPQVWAIGWCSRSSSSLGLAKESSRGPGWRHFQDKIEVKVQEDSFEIS